MNDMIDWEKKNSAYLTAALKWLRLLMSKPPESLQTLPDSPAPADEPPHGAGSDREEIVRVKEEMAAEEGGRVPPALVILARCFGLSKFEEELLILCAAMELDTRIPALCALAQNDPNKPYPTFALAASLFENPAWDAFSPERPLRYFSLLEIDQRGAVPLISCPLRADERIVSYIRGLNYLDSRLSPLLRPVEPVVEALPPSQENVVNSILRHLEVSNAQPTRVIQLTGSDSRSKQLIAGRIAATAGFSLHLLPVETLPSQPAELETLARIWERDSLLLPVVLYLDSQESALGEHGDHDPSKLSAVRNFVSRRQGVFFVDTREVMSELPGSIVFDVVKPEPSEQLEVWKKFLNSNGDEGPRRLAGQFNLDVASIRRIARDALSEKSENGLQERVWRWSLAAVRPRMETLARRLDPKATWDDLVLPAEATALLRRIAEQVRNRIKVYEQWGFHRKMNRGLGISALFAGESGTGKTMAAEVIANELRLDLYRIDLSAVVSKYIGETEKNLRRLFDAAEDGGAILFFDEADALFGKRSEVKDSHDRYANIEINYLLQRMEGYRGLAILATNMKSGMDDAFVRRLRFIVNFPFPGPSQRKAIWEKVFPAETPKDELDYDRLSRFNLTGGAISNIAVNSAFMAACAEGNRVTMSLVLEAARSEFRKIEKPINEAEFFLEQAVCEER